MLIVWFFVYKKLAQFAVRGALPHRRSESPVCTTDNKPSWVLHLLGWFIGSCGFSSLERRPEFCVLHSQPRDCTWVSHNVGISLLSEASGKPKHSISVTNYYSCCFAAVGDAAGDGGTPAWRLFPNQSLVSTQGLESVYWNFFLLQLTCNYFFLRSYC